MKKSNGDMLVSSLAAEQGSTSVFAQFLVAKTLEREKYTKWRRSPSNIIPWVLWLLSAVFLYTIFVGLVSEPSASFLEHGGKSWPLVLLMGSFVGLCIRHHALRSKCFDEAYAKVKATKSDES